MTLLEINEVKDTIKIVGIKKVLQKIEENKGYLWENDFFKKEIIKEEDVDKYIAYNTEINEYYEKSTILQMEKTKKSSASTSFIYNIKNCSHTGYITFSRGVVGVIKK